MIYRKHGKISWAKLSHFSRFSGASLKFFCEYMCCSLIVLNNEYLWPRQRESISVKTLIALKPQIFSPANLSPSTVNYTCVIHAHLHICICWYYVLHSWTPHACII